MINARLTRRELKALHTFSTPLGSVENYGKARRSRRRVFFLRPRDARLRREEPLET